MPSTSEKHMIHQLTFSRRLFYGMGGLSMVLPDLVMIQWLAYRYLPPDGKALVPPALFGALFFLGRMTEGLSCPVMGHWSDTCHHRWGRRLPFIRFGIGPYLLVFFLLFHPPGVGAQWVIALYAFLLMECYFFLYTTVFTPYLALLPELTADLKERIDLTTVQAIFIMVAAFVFGGLGLVLEHGGWLALSGCATLLVLISFTPMLVALREHPPEDAEPRLALWHSICLTWENRPFLHLVFATSCYFFGLNGMLLLLPYWVRVGLGGREDDVTLLMLPYLLTSVPCFFVFNYLAPRVGKYRLMLATFILTGLVMLAFALIGRLPFGTAFVQTAVVMGLLGMPVAGFMMLPYAVLADVIDYDEVRTRRRREAVYFGVQGVVQKVFMGLSVLAFTVIPYWGGEGGVSTFGMKVMAALCGLMCLAGAVVFLGYPLRERGGKIVYPG
jgi:GPH family glycoside/pentoside/hexuronide:cation symporter